MCLGVPGQILSISDEDTMILPAKVDFGGIAKTISLCFTPDAQVGDYVLVHVGFAISIIDEKRAEELLQFLDNELEEHHEISN